QAGRRTADRGGSLGGARTGGHASHAGGTGGCVRSRRGRGPHTRICPCRSGRCPCADQGKRSRDRQRISVAKIQEQRGYILASSRPLRRMTFCVKPPLCLIQLRTAGGEGGLMARGIS